MNKTKLDVVRINEDVIATSAEFCTDHADHYFVTAINLGTDNDAINYYYEDGKWYYDDDSAAGTGGTANVAVGKYYFCVNDEVYTECTKQHNTSAVTYKEDTRH